MNIHVKFGFNHICSFYEKAITAFSPFPQHKSIYSSGGHLWFPIGIKNKNSVEDLPMILDPMEKIFQNASTLKPLGQLNPNCPGMNIGRPSTNFMFFYADRESKMAATAGHRSTLDSMGTCWNAFRTFQWSFLGSLVSIIQVVSEKKRFETFSH
jgi:hypothetical protein